MQDNDLIFPTSHGTPQDSNNIRREFYKLLDESGLPRIRFHDLRHTTASMLLNHGVPVIVVSRILGHSKSSVTLDLYGHLYHEMQELAVQVLDQLNSSASIEEIPGLLPSFIEKNQ